MPAVLTSVSHDPQACYDALRGAAPGTEIVIDLETTGLERRHRIVSVGVLVRSALFILFVGSIELSVVPFNIDLTALRAALAPLAERTDLLAVFHNAIFDLGFLKRVGIEVRCAVYDTAKLLLLADPDRKSKLVWRFNHRHQQSPNYRLKDVLLLELNIDAPHFPGAAERLGYREHVRYLASDCVITRKLFDFLKQTLRPADFHYYSKFAAPVTPLLVNMTNAGVNADAEFITSECDRLVALMRNLSDMHKHRFGQPLDAGDFALRGYIYFLRSGLRCFVPKSKWVRVGARRLPPLKSATLAALRNSAASGSQRHESLGLVLDYLLLRGLLTKLATLRDKQLDATTSRIYTTLDDWQASGRVSATKPNLQGVANNVTKGGKRELVSSDMAGVVIKSRNALCAPAGATLAAFDIAQADIRGWAHVSATLSETGAQLIERLQRERTERLESAIGPYLGQMWQHYRPKNRKPVVCPTCGAVQPARRQLTLQIVLCWQCHSPITIEGRAPHFDPAEPSRLVEDFRRGGSDFYTVVTNRILGRPPRDKTERNVMKQTILGMVNGMSAIGLAAKLDVDVAAARSYLERFAAGYPKETAFIELMHHAAAITGCSESFGGRRRRVTPHYWMVTEPEVELFLSYRGADKLWVRVVPLQPGRHTLTCWVKSVVDAKYDSPRRGQEIYHHRDGRISQAPYRFFDDAKLIFGLPVRNISWRIIRRVRTATEECTYQGFDTTRRQLANHIFQGSTADIARLMMIRSQPICRDFGARLVLQIHDELLFEVPGSQRRLMQFVRAAAKVLQQPPTPDFAVPITVEPKIGRRFGELRELERWEYASPWHVRMWRQWVRLVHRWIERWRSG